jgi:hypothetical protein
MDDRWTNQLLIYLNIALEADTPILEAVYLGLSSEPASKVWRDIPGNPFGNPGPELGLALQQNRWRIVCNPLGLIGTSRDDLDAIILQKRNSCICPTSWRILGLHGSRCYKVVLDTNAVNVWFRIVDPCEISQIKSNALQVRDLSDHWVYFDICWTFLDIYSAPHVFGDRPHRFTRVCELMHQFIEQDKPWTDWVRSLGS